MNKFIEKIIEIGAWQDRACSKIQRENTIKAAEELYIKHILELKLLKTPHLDNLINDLKAYKRNDMLSDNGKNQLNEYEAIKQALTIPAVVEQSEQLVCDHKYHNRDITTNGECTKCKSYKWR